MNARHLFCLLLAGLLLAVGCPDDGDDDDTTAADDDDATADDDDDAAAGWVLGEIVDTEGAGILARMDGPWGDDLWIVRVEGTEYEMGYQYGRLQGQMMLDLWWTFIGEIGAELGASDPEDADFLVGSMLDKAWGQFEPFTDPAQLEMVEGIAQGMEDAGCEYGEDDVTVTNFVHRMLAMAEFAISSHMSGDDIIGLTHLLDSGYSDELLDYYDAEAAAFTHALPGDDGDALATAWDLLSDPEPFESDGDPILNCSTYAAWGERTDGGALLGTRNMDFSSDTGIGAFANLAAFVPDDGVPWVSISWVGMTLGGLAAVNQQGVGLGHAQASSPMERLATECGVLKASRLLQHATDLDSALDIMQSAPTMGVTGMISWGDPLNAGAGAEAAAFEQNGISFAVHRNRHDCSVESSLYRYDLDGAVDAIYTHDEHPELANLEADAREIDGDANVRYFSCTDPCATLDDLVLDEGEYVELPGPAEGVMPIQTGYPLDCAVYRGDSAFSYGVRMHQSASRGPMDGDGTGLMIEGGAYRDRYYPQMEMTEAYAAGVAYTWDDVEVIADNGGQATPLTLDQVEQISRVAGMPSSNVWNVVFDATHLVTRLSYESGTGDTWTAAKYQPEYLEIDLADVFLTD